MLLRQMHTMSIVSLDKMLDKMQAPPRKAGHVVSTAHPMPEAARRRGRAAHSMLPSGAFTSPLSGHVVTRRASNAPDGRALAALFYIPH